MMIRFGSVWKRCGKYKSVNNALGHFPRSVCEHKPATPTPKHRTHETHEKEKECWGVLTKSCATEIRSRFHTIITWSSSHRSFISLLTMPFGLD